MADHVARAVVRLRYVVIAGWVAAAVTVPMLLPDFDEAQTGSLGELVATDAPAIDAEVRSHELFRFPLLSRTVVVQRDPDGLGAGTLRQTARAITQLNLRKLPALRSIAFALGASNALGKPPFSREKSTTALTYLFFPVQIGPAGRTGLARLYARRYLDHPKGGFVGVTGAAPARAEQSRLVNDALPLVEIATIALVLVVTALHFRAPGAPLVNLASIGIAYTIASRLVAVAGEQLGVVVPAEVEPVIVALLFGIVTDYSIFFLDRFRGGLARGELPREAALKTTSELMPIIFVAGIAVAAASATLAFARLGFFQAFGPGLALSVLVALAVVMTFVPASLAVFGRALFWPARPRVEARRRGGRRLRDHLRRLREQSLTLPTRRPLVVAVATAVPLLALSFGLLGLDVGNRTMTSLPSGAEPKRAYRQAAMGFAPGVLSPTVVIVEGEGVTRERVELRRLQALIERRRGVAAVLGPGEARGPTDLGAVYSLTGAAARYFVVLDANPFGSRAIRIADDLAADLPGLLESVGLDATASLAGDTAISAQTVTRSRQDIARVVPAAAFVVFLILAVFLRALVAPLYLVLTSLLALAASLGLTVIVFQGLLGAPDLGFYVPFAATVLLVALGSDYNVYLVGRIWGEARTRPLREAVAVGGSRATASITVAGLVLAASFAAVALVPLSAFHQLAFAVSAGLLIDAFVVRSLLTPALITLVGESSGWPGRRLRRST